MAEGALGIGVLLLLFAGLVYTDTVKYSNAAVRRGNAAGAGGDQMIMIGYGYGKLSVLETIEMYNYEIGTWTTYTIPPARMNAAAGYASGEDTIGNELTDIVVFDTSGMTYWHDALAEPRTQMAAASSGDLIFFGGGLVSGDGMPDVFIYDTSADNWDQIAFFSGVGRGNLAAASSGSKIYFAGGEDSGDAHSEVDIYDVSKGQWIDVQQLGVPRYGLAGAGTGDLVLFAGGTDSGGTVFATVDICNTTSGDWDSLELSEARSYVGGVASAEGLFFFGGGSYSTFDSDVLDIYDATIGSWHIGELSDKGHSISAATDGNDKVLLTGGMNFAAAALTARNDIVVSPGCRPRSALAVSVDDEVYFLGGVGGGPDGDVSYSRVDIYESLTGKWRLDNIIHPRRDAAAAYSDGWIFIGGGRTLGNNTEILSVVMYNVSTGFKAEAELCEERSFLAAAGTGTKVYFGGGYPLSAAVDVFTIGFPTPIVEALSVPRYQLAAASYGDVVYFAGGRNETSSIDVVDIFSTKGTTVKYLSWPRFNLAGASVGHLVFFAGGENGLYYFEEVDVFDSMNNSQSVIKMTNPRTQLAAVGSEEGAVVAFGGGRNVYGPLSSVEIYNITYGTWMTVSLSVATYDLAGGATETSLVFFAGRIEDGTFSCAVDVFGVETPSQASSSASSTSSTHSTSSGSTSSSHSSSATSSQSASSPSSGNSADLLIQCIESPACLYLSIIGIVFIAFAMLSVLIVVLVLIVVAIGSAIVIVSSRKSRDAKEPGDGDYYSQSVIEELEEADSSALLYFEPIRDDIELEMSDSITQHPNPDIFREPDSRSPFLEPEFESVVLPPEIDDD